MSQFHNLVTGEASNLLDKLKWEAENQHWLDRSRKIALMVLSTLRVNRKASKFPSTQKDLAEAMHISPQQVNKILKGGENLTLETISRLEQALAIELIALKSIVHTELIYRPNINHLELTSSVTEVKLTKTFSTAGTTTYQSHFDNIKGENGNKSNYQTAA